MKKDIQRRGFLKTVLAAPVLGTTGIVLSATAAARQAAVEKPLASRLKLSLNAYSFNEPLTRGNMTLIDLLHFCADQNFDAVDLTGYYFPGYPAVPADDYIYQLKQTAFRLGLDVSGTGVRNDFTQPDAAKRKDDIDLVKKWIVAAAKLGAPVIRIFSGTQLPTGYTWDEVSDWVVEAIKECADYGRQHGVLVAMQNHNDFIKTGTQAQKIVEAVGSDWFGLVLDIGSYRSGDVYQQIRDTAKYAFNWQIKEAMYVNGTEQKTDLQKVIAIVKASGYRGYIPIETLGAGDPRQKVPLFLAQVRQAVAATGS